MFKDFRGLVVPEHDCEEVLVRRVVQCAEAVEAIEAFGIEPKVMVQAGGNWGWWPRVFGLRFETVYTFEPDAVCFACLAANTASQLNVVRFQAALGNERKLIDLERDTDTTGNQHVAGPGIYPTLCLDDLQLPRVDLLYLDVEGEEDNAVHGARETILRCRPVVIFEGDEKYDPQRMTEAYLMSLGYKAAGFVGRRDMVMRYNAR
jgi:FkbM family methyltransferase